jgi:hypothetical protein
LKGKIKEGTILQGICFSKIADDGWLLLPGLPNCAFKRISQIEEDGGKIVSGIIYREDSKLTPLDENYLVIPLPVIAFEKIQIGSQYALFNPKNPKGSSLCLSLGNLLEKASKDTGEYLDPQKKRLGYFKPYSKTLVLSLGKLFSIEVVSLLKSGNIYLNLPFLTGAPQ